MEQVKSFITDLGYRDLGEKLESMEADINCWLAEHPEIKVTKRVVVVLDDDYEKVKRTAVMIFYQQKGWLARLVSKIFGSQVSDPTI